MTTPAGFCRDMVKDRYALFTPEGFVPSVLPGWTDCVVNIVISPALGANLSQLLITLSSAGRGASSSQETEFLLYVVEGGGRVTVAGEKRELSRGHYVYVPPKTDYAVDSAQEGTRLLIFEKRFQPLAGEKTPVAVFGDAGKIQGLPFLGNPRALLQTLLPDGLPFDMAVNIFTYEPGAALPFVESHIMEHGLLMLAGAGIYRLESDWHPVQAGDVIWMAPYCAQWFAAVGDVPASYIYYKDVNRRPL
jgi:(S)-ureidoglycine aminohydrolase